MRSALLILIPLAVLASVFYFVVIGGRPASSIDTGNAQYSSTPATRKIVPTTIPTLDQSASFVGVSSNVWVESRNRRGNLTNKFRSARFDPRSDGSFDVTFPQALFYGDSGGVVTLEGSSGKVTLSQPGERSDPKALGASSPTSGDLENVIIRFYDETLNDEPVGEATLVAQVAKVHFDAIANSVATVDSVIEGKGVVADRVPVNMRGRDFDFDGYGLKMRWNDRDGRLDALEIARGERLVIKNIEQFGLPSESKAPKPTAARSPAFSPTALLDGIALAEPATTSTTAPAAPKMQLYHATFDREVTVMRDGKQVAAGDVMRVIVPLGEAKTPRGQKASTSSAAGQQTSAEPRRRAATRPAAKKSSTSPTTAPATTIEIRWTGPLTVRPVDVKTPQGEMVELIGAPAWVEENGSRADARLIRVERDAGRLRLEPGGAIKAINIHDAGGAELRSRSTLNVDRTAGIGTIEGGGSLTMPASTTQPDPTTITWSRRLELNTATGDESYLKRVTIEGEANVKNKQLAVTGDGLTLGFDKPSPKPATTDATTTKPANVSMPAADLSALRGVVATGNAKIIMGADAARRTLAANRIELGFVAGAKNDAALQTVHCIERVALDDANGFSLSCGTLDAKLKPTDFTTPVDADADPLANIDSLLATEAVALKQADGSSAAGERLELITADDAKKMTLAGTPARVASARGGLEGERILLDPASGDVDVPGPGRFTGTGDAAQPNTTMAIAWLESMKAIGNTGTCDLKGGVRIDGATATGTHLNATAQSGKILFTPRSRGLATTKPATPAVAGASLDAIRSVNLSGDVDLAMESADIRTSSLQTQRLDIDWENGTLTAPQPGRLLVIDGAAAATRPTTAPTSEPTMQLVAATMPTTRKSSNVAPGSLAVAWQNQLFWNMREGHLTFDGGVRLGFEREGTNDPIKMNCDRVLCELAPVNAGQGADQMAQRVDLRTVTGEGNLSVRSKLASFDAATLKFDAVTHRATATGSADTPVQVFDEDATSHVGFSAITWNLDTGIIEDFRDIDSRVRR